MAAGGPDATPPRSGLRPAATARWRSSLGPVSLPSRIYVGRRAGMSVFDPLGDPVGRVRDAVVTFRTDSIGRPRVIGLVLEVPARKRVFVPMTRVTSIDADQVITTGLGGVFPADVLVGVVREVVPEVSGKSSIAVIEPGADPRTVRHAFIITNF